MSSSRYTETTPITTAPGVSRNYSDNSQYRGNANYRDVDYDERHHGRWTATGESRDLADSTGRSSSFLNRDRDHDGRRDFSRDRDYNRDRDYDRDYDRTRGYHSGYESSYGSGLPFGSSHYGSSYGMGSSLPHYGSSYGMGSSFPHTYGTGYGMGSSFPTHHYGSSYGMGSTFPHHYGTGYGMGSTFPHHYGTGYGMGSSFPHYGMGSTLPPYGSGMTSRSVRGSTFGSTPEVDIYEVGNDYIIELDLPGHSRDHVDTKLYGNELVITSKPPRRSHNFHINERSLGQSDVSRRLYLPQDAHTGNINATLTNGVLKVIIPRNLTTGATTGTTGTVLPTTGTTGSVLPTTHMGTTTTPVTVVKDTVTTTTETRRI